MSWIADSGKLDALMNWRNHISTDHSLEAVIELDWKIMIHALHYNVQAYK